MGRKYIWRVYQDARATAAVEFAIVAPATLILFAGIVVFSFWLSVYSALQQVAAEAARAALSGLSSSQQTQYATQYVNATIPNYSFIDPTKISVATSSTSTTLQVSITYDATNSFFANAMNTVVSRPASITRSATVQLSGF